MVVHGLNATLLAILLHARYQRTPTKEVRPPLGQPDHGEALYSVETSGSSSACFRPF